MLAFIAIVIANMHTSFMIVFLTIIACAMHIFVFLYFRSALVTLRCGTSDSLSFNGELADLKYVSLAMHASLISI